MIDFIKAYIKRIDQLYHTKEATEHSYRSALEELVRNCTGYKNVINEQKHINCGAPDLTINNNKDIPLAYIQAKDIDGGDLDGRKKNKEQFDRYKAALHTIIFTDYIDFHLYEDGSFVKKAELAYSDNGHIYLNEDAIPHFISIIEHLKNLQPQTISSPSKLATLMANKAKMIAEAVRLDLKNDKEKKGSLHTQLEAFKNILDKTLNEEKFADLYAQTVAYGLFAARLHDKTPGFTREEAAKLIPQTNPFLQELFRQLAGYYIKDSIAWIVDDLVAAFAATDVEKLRKNISREMEKRDPMIHFYEEFLSEYDPAAKKKFGVYYTPKPVVEFIVRAVDDILKTEFGLPQGLADKSMVNVPIKKVEQDNDIATETIEPRHRVQILDPATGTGTFLAEVVSRIKEQQQPGIWPKYVDEHLIPRIHGFEYMIAPYTIAHLKLDMLINWWGDKQLEKEHTERVNIYLTNALTQTDLINKKSSIAAAIAEEANEANEIKHNARVMVMLGNPPYSVSSSNKGKDFEWIEGLLNDYKKNLNERNIQPLSDDYIKFIRLGQHFIEQTGEGILAYISNNSFLFFLIHRQMRRELMRCFDDIYILDLHGNNRKKETAPDGSKDENVFAIMQGVSINIFVKKPNSENKQATIHHCDLFGSRKYKYNFLSINSISSIIWNIIQPSEPNLYFIPKDFSCQEEYNKGFRIDALMKNGVCGIQTGRDNLYVDFNENELNARIQKLLSGDIDNDFRQQYKVQDSSGYNMLKRVKLNSFNSKYVRKQMYRPFDIRYIYYSPNLIKRAFYGVMGQMHKPNIGLITSRQLSTFDYQHVLCTDMMTDMCSISAQTKECSYLFPLYVYDEGSIDQPRIPNLDETIWRTIENWVKYKQAYKPLTASEQSGELGFDAKPEEPHFLTPEDIFDYIYGVLHSPYYREKYKEFLKVDFPRIPYPKNKDEFEHYKDCGHQLRELHLMHKVPEVHTIISSGSGKIEKVQWDNGKVYINDTQYFDGVPAEAWNMYIGGYQPAQKWLKDRKGRTLTTDDMEHYEKIISVLLETNRIMQQMDNPAEQVEELKKKVATLEHQLQAQQHSDIHYHINAQNISLQTEGTINIGEINDK